MPPPRRIGDTSIIAVGVERYGKPRRRVRVILLEAENGSRWLVESKP